MGFENSPIDTPVPENASEIETKHQSKKMSGGKIGRWIKSTAALAGAVGVGYFGSMKEAGAPDVVNHDKSTGAKLEHKETDALRQRLESSDSFDLLYEDADVIWGVEQVKKSKEGRTLLAQRYVKIDVRTGEKKVIGEYDNVIQARDGLDKIAGIPDQVLRNAHYYAGAIETERAFQASGFVKATGHTEGATHIEKRDFKGYSVHANNTVEVDEQGKVVRLVDSESQPNDSE